MGSQNISSVYRFSWTARGVWVEELGSKAARHKYLITNHYITTFLVFKSRDSSHKFQVSNTSKESTECFRVVVVVVWGKFDK